MSKVVNLRELVGPLHVLRGASDLAATGLISPAAFALSAYVAHRMAIEERRETTIVVGAAKGALIISQGRIIAGPMRGTSLELIAALQEVHFSVGIHSHIYPDCLDEEDVEQRHFSLSPDLRHQRDWNLYSTAITFRIAQHTAEMYGKAITNLIYEGAQGAQALEFGQE